MAKFTRPFFDGFGNPLLNAIITLRNENGNVIYYTATEIKGISGYVGCYTFSIDVSGKYWIWIQPNALSSAQLIGEFSPELIITDDI